MAEFVKPETVQAIAQQFYGYALAAGDAQRVAAAGGALAQNAAALSELGIEGVEVPFDFSALLAAADRLRRRSR